MRQGLGRKGQPGGQGGKDRSRKSLVQPCHQGWARSPVEVVKIGRRHNRNESGKSAAVKRQERRWASWGATRRCRVLVGFCPFLERLIHCHECRFCRLEIVKQDRNPPHPLVVEED